MRRATDRLARLTASEWAALAVAAAVLISPRELNEGPVICPFRRLTGKPCPVCGMSRSWSSLARLRMRDSLRFHPLGPLTFVGALWLAVAGRGGRTPPALSSAPSVGAFTTLWLLVWLRRLAGGSAAAAQAAVIESRPR